jgi:hypothetical protein
VTRYVDTGISRKTTTTYLLKIGLASSPLASPARHRVATLFTVTNGAAIRHGTLLGRRLCILLACGGLNLTAQVSGQLPVLFGSLTKAVLEYPVVPAMREQSAYDLFDIVDGRD